MGGGDDAVRPGGEGAPGALGNDVAERARDDEAGVEIGAVERGEHADGEDPGGGAAAPGHGRLDDMGIAVHGEEIRLVAVGEAAHRPRHRGPDVEELHVEEDALAAGLQLPARSRPPSASSPSPIL